MPPFGKGFHKRSYKTVGCSHMSGLRARLLWPLALMISADLNPIHIDELAALTKPRVFSIPVFDR